MDRARLLVWQPGTDTTAITVNGGFKSQPAIVRFGHDIASSMPSSPMSLLQVPERTHSPCDVVRKNQGNRESRLPCRRLSDHGRLFGEDPGFMSLDKRFSRCLW
ncbi:uncharacterized protein LOC142559529 isoform X2 [Dermacentor variabilis]|uniref:uncharacterized protein LOC142559529 isoform X2 n=1 Tax=Dermacentor variabilis TaxID=34621 RepID=UPI003F5B634D